MRKSLQLILSAIILAIVLIGCQPVDTYTILETESVANLSAPGSVKAIAGNGNISVTRYRFYATRSA